MPHKRSLEDLARGRRDALEAERRVAYVAFTRAQQRLVVLTSTGNASRFCVEAGLVEAPCHAPQPAPGAGAVARAGGARCPRRRRRARSPTTTSPAARSASPDADPREILGACRSIATAQRVLALTVRSADAPCVERLTAGRRPRC